MFEQVLINLQRAKDNYRGSLSAIDGELRKMVSQDPTQIAAARAIQATYGEGFEPAVLKAGEQPAAPVMTAPKRARKAKTAGKAKSKK